eukprot:11399314-Alexandrium_andersonii.AAC.1
MSASLVGSEMCIRDRCVCPLSGEREVARNDCSGQSPNAAPGPTASAPGRHRRTHAPCWGSHAR